MDTTNRFLIVCKHHFAVYFLALPLCLGVLCAIASGEEKPLPNLYRKLLPLHNSLAKPERGDWLAEHRETGQTYQKYLASHPIRAEKNRKTIYVQPLGELTKTQKKIVDLSAEFIGDYYMLPVRILDPLSLSEIPAEARRQRDEAETEQLLTTYILHDLLKPRVTENAVALIAITPFDLWPGKGWNFVFGQATLSDRVGVWSFHRYGDPERSDDAFRLCLLRTIKTATHELGHMFSMQHCIQLECNMNGSNSLPESDRHPLEVCPHCLAKLCHATGANPLIRFKKLAEFCKNNGFDKEREVYEKSLEIMTQ